MASRMDFVVDENLGTRRVSIDIRGTIRCGYTARDRSAVEQHIEKLKHDGVPVPPATPMYFPTPPRGLTFSPVLWVDGDETSGEIEFVILAYKDEIFIGVGSDHTDRNMERYNVMKAKLVCPAVMSRQLWVYREIKEHFDAIEIRSWAVTGTERILYQESTLRHILAPEDLLDRVKGVVDGPLQGLAVFSGTPPLLEGKDIYADRFEGELYDPYRKLRLTVGYEVRQLDWFKR